MKSLFTFIFTFFTIVLFAQNPIITHMYTADPTARVYDGKLFLYPSHDLGVCNESQGSNGFCMPDYHVFSTEDMVNWKDYGVIVDQNEVPWGAKDRYGMWAPTCAYKNKKYYYYYPAIPKDGSAFRRVGVAISDKPEGPFVQHPSYLDKVKGIDPDVLVDDDGSAYLYYGSGRGPGKLKVVALNKDMVSVKGSPKPVEGINNNGYKEGSFVFKRNGWYYFTYARVGKNNYQIDYGISKNPMGPFVDKGVALPNIGKGTNHHSIVQFKGKWYIFYHNWAISGNNKLRSVCVDELTFNADGTIKPVKATLRGVGIPKAGDIIQIDAYNKIYNAAVHKVQGNQPLGFQVDHIQDGGYVKFDKVDFGKGCLKTLKVRASCGSKGGVLELRENTLDGKLLASVNITNTKSWNNWQTFEGEFKKQTKGIQNIFCVFKGDDKELFNVNWIKFSSAKVPNSKIITAYETQVAPQKVKVNPETEGTVINSKLGDILYLSDAVARDMDKVKLEKSKGNKFNNLQLGQVKNNGWVKYKTVDFENCKDVTVRVVYANRGKGNAVIEIRSGSKYGKVLTKINIPSTTKQNKWELIETTFKNSTKGPQNLYFIFKGTSKSKYLYNLNAVQFVSKENQEPLKQHALEAYIN